MYRKWYFKPFLVAIVIALLLIISQVFWCKTYAFEKPTGDPLKEPVVIRTTCYTAREGSKCSSGVIAHEGVIAACKEWQGKAVALYTFEYVNGKPVPKECIGLYTVLDTGAGIDTDGDGKGDSIKNGESIDVYCNTLHEAEEFISRYGDYTLMILIDGEG